MPRAEFVLPVCLSSFCIFSNLLFSQQLNVIERKLENGMTILIHPDHDIPNVALYLFFRVGSRNERPGTTGMSHFFEHMMFNGAKKFGPKQFDVVMEKNGGANNAYTSRDLTVYTDWFPKPALELLFDMEADRIRDLAFDPKLIESERGVVYSERRLRTDNSTSGTLYEQVNAAAFTAHPYGWPVVGWPSDIESWTLEDLKAHYRMGYAPNNSLVVVAGAVTEEEVMRLAKKYFEPIPRQNPPLPVKTKEPAQEGERRVTVRKPAEAPLLMVSYHVPESRHADWRPLELLSAVLSQGRSSRLHRRLVDREQLATDVAAELDASLDPGQLFMTVELQPGVDVPRAERVLWEEVERVRSEGVKPEELAKARNQLLASMSRSLKTIASKANTIGLAEIYFGGWRTINTQAADLEKVTAEDLKRVASSYLAEKNRTVGTLVPEKESAP